MTVPLQLDPVRAGLVTSVRDSALGPVVVRHSPARTSDTALLLLHGAAASWSTWTPLVAAAEQAGRPLTDLVIPDLPGWGESPGPADPRELTSRTLVPVLADVVCSLGYTRWRVVGHSLGAIVALDLAALEPDRTTALVLAAPPVAGVGAVVRHPIRAAASMPWFAGMLALMRFGAAAPRFADRVLTLLCRLRLLPLIAAPLFGDRRTVDASVAEALAGEVRPAAFVAAARDAGARLDGTPAGAGWHGIRCPVDAVAGDRDVFGSRSDHAALLDAVPGATWNALSGCGHFPHIERPADVLALLVPA